jgi:predicted ATPase/serine/threonine protein kinase
MMEYKPIVIVTFTLPPDFGSGNYQLSPLAGDFMASERCPSEAEENARVLDKLPSAQSSETVSCAKTLNEVDTVPLTSFLSGEPAAGLILGDTYRLERPLGRGGMGEVWLATHLLLNELRAIKLVLTSYVTNPEIRERFIQGEARNALRLQHPHIVRVYDLGQHRGMPFIVMEYVAGGPHGVDLGAWLRAEGQLSPARCGLILEQLAQALAVAHRQGLVHCDIKPTNILVTEQLEVKLGDFGLVKDLRQALELGGGVYGLGSPEYMAPEQARGEVEPRSDLYSLGVVLFEMLTGQLPFTSGSTNLLYQHARVAPPSLCELNPLVSPEIEQVILRSLAKEPHDRYNSVLEFSAAYQQALHGDKTATYPGLRAGGQEAPALPGLPGSGVLTFLFTDIQGSTQLWEYHPEAMKLALARHDEIMRQAIESHQGYVFKMVGDAFHAVFTQATDALAATIQAQKELAIEKWAGEIGAIKVRMALHTCHAENHQSDYVSPNLNRLARLMATAHGGQTLLSLATTEQVQAQLPPEVTLEDMGEHHLKDLIRPEHIYQLNIAGLPDRFPPLKSSHHRPNNLPAPLTSFVGREREVSEVLQLLTKSRILTLTGTGGTGKTRLSLHLASQLVEKFSGGVWLVELAALSDPSLVIQAIATVLGLSEQPGKTLLGLVSEYLRREQVLMVLDNCEHMLAECARVVNYLTQSCPDLVVLATSREGLGINGEIAYQVPSLGLPRPSEATLPPPEKLLEYAAIRLFVERAKATNPGFELSLQNAPAVVQICQRLDGIPLALELAAARVKVITVEQINTRLGDRFRLLVGGSRTALPRQQTLRALIDWSYEMLTRNEQLLWQRLSVFSGGWSLEAAERVCAGGEIEEFEILDLLFQLANKSLIVASEEATASSGMRYSLLETIRHYGWEKLEQSGELNRVRDRHLAYFKEMAQSLAPKVTGPGQTEALAQLEGEHDNIRSALEWSLTSTEQRLPATRLEKGLELAIAVARFWTIRNYWSEGERWLARIVATTRAGELEKSSNFAYALSAQGNLARERCDYTGGLACQEESLALFQQLGEPQGMAMAHHGIALINWSQGAYTNMGYHFQECLTLNQTLGNQRGLAMANLGLAIADYNQRHLLAAATNCQQAIRLFEIVDDKWGLAVAVKNLGLVFYSRGDSATAQNYFQKSLSLSQQIGYRVGIITSLLNLGLLAQEKGNYKEAFDFYQKSLAETLALGQQFVTARTLTALAGLVEALGYHRGGSTEPTTDETNPECLKIIARLSGASSALLSSINGVLEQPEYDIYNRVLQAARGGLKEEEFTGLFYEGQTTPVEALLGRTMSWLEQNLASSPGPNNG